MLLLYVLFMCCLLSDGFVMCDVDCCVAFFFFFFKQKTAYEMRISDWSSDVCSSDLILARPRAICKPARVTMNDWMPIIAVAIPCNAQKIGRASCRERVCQYV